MSGVETRKARLEREWAQAIRFLSGGVASRQPAAKEDRVLLETADRGTISISDAVLREMQRQGLVTTRDGQLSLTSEGRAHAKCLVEPIEPFRSQHWRVEARAITTSGKIKQSVAMNLAESPLGVLARRRDRNGVSFLSHAEFNAGERLRADYKRGQIMPRLNANWTASVAQSKRSAGPAGATELTEAALAARLGVEKALDGVGPELAGALAQGGSDDGACCAEPSL